MQVRHRPHLLPIQVRMKNTSLPSSPPPHPFGSPVMAQQYETPPAQQQLPNTVPPNQGWSNVGSTSTTSWSIPTILSTSTIRTTIIPNVSDTNQHAFYYTAEETAARTVLYWYLTCHSARDWWCLCGDTDKSRITGRKSSNQCLKRLLLPRRSHLLQRRHHSKLRIPVLYPRQCLPMFLSARLSIGRSAWAWLRQRRWTMGAL